MSCILCVSPSHVLHAQPMLCCLECWTATMHSGFMIRARYLHILLIERIGAREERPLTLSLIIRCTDQPFSVTAGKFWFNTSDGNVTTASFQIFPIHYSSVTLTLDLHAPVFHHWGRRAIEHKEPISAALKYVYFFFYTSLYWPLLILCLFTYSLSAGRVAHGSCAKH